MSLLFQSVLNIFWNIFIPITIHPQYYLYQLKILQSITELNLFNHFPWLIVSLFPFSSSYNQYYDNIHKPESFAMGLIMLLE